MFEVKQIDKLNSKFFERGLFIDENSRFDPVFNNTWW